MSNEVVGVQPMPGPVALGFALRYNYLKGALHAGDSDTKHIHDTDATKTTLKGDFDMSTKVTTNKDAAKYKDTVYPAHGIKGIETKAKLTIKSVYTAEVKDTDGKVTKDAVLGTADLLLIDGQGYPVAQEVKFAHADGKAITFPFGYSFTIDNAVAESATASVVGVSSWSHTGLQTGKLDKDGKVVASGTALFEDMASAEMGYQNFDTAEW
jgi:hypothetical protein